MNKLNAVRNAQYSPIDVKQYDRVHDRYLCIDNTIYHIGASLKDLGKRWFSFNKIRGVPVALRA